MKNAPLGARFFRWKNGRSEAAVAQHTQQHVFDVGAFLVVHRHQALEVFLFERGDELVLLFAGAPTFLLPLGLPVASSSER